jgi:hypothetical protein
MLFRYAKRLLYAGQNKLNHKRRVELAAVDGGGPPKVTSLLWGGANLVPVRWLQLRLRSSVRRFLRCSYRFWWRLRSFIWCLRQLYLQELFTAPPTVLSRFALTHPLHFPVAPRRLGGAVSSFAAVPEQTLEEYEDRVEERGWRGRAAYRDEIIRIHREWDHGGEFLREATTLELRLLMRNDVCAYALHAEPTRLLGEEDVKMVSILFSRSRLLN